jgi:selenoprotein W-related protein
LAGKLLTEYKQKIQSLELEPSGGGAFELSANGELLYSKLAEGRFPDESAMLALVGKRLKK